MPETIRKDETVLAGHPVEYEVRRSPDATEPRIDVDVHGTRVVLPDGSDADPDELLAANANWVLDKRTKYDRYREQAPERSFEPGETFPYRGEDHEVVIEKRHTSAVEDGTFRLARSHVEQTSIKNALEHLYRKEAREHFEDRADTYAERMGLEYDSIELWNQRTRWGSCSTNGTLSFNWRLVMAPEDVIDYVVVHEIAHLREPEHSAEFWSLVGEHYPDYQEHVEWLEQNSTRLIFSEEDL